MPSQDWIKAASQTDRRPVLWMSVESVDAIKKELTTAADWAASPVKTNINTESPLDPSGSVILATDGSEPHAGQYQSPASIPTGSQASVLAHTGNVTGPLPGANSRVTGVDVVVVLHMAGTMPFAFALQGSLNGGAWTDLATWLQPSAANSTFTFSLGKTGLTKGSWSFRLICTNDFGSSLSNVKVSSWTTQYETRYLASGSLQSKSVDLGVIPTVPSVLSIDDQSSATATLSYTAKGSNDNSSWTSLGAVHDGSTVAAYRYYAFTCSFASTDGVQTPVLAEIAVSGGDSQFTYLSTHEDYPTPGARPLLINSLGSLSSKLELMELGTTGEISPRLYYLKDTFELLRDGKLRNKTVTVSLGFEGLPAVDFEDVFSGFWHDGSLDLYRAEITVKTRTIMARFQKAQIPAELASGSTRNDASVQPVDWTNVNIIDAMTNVIDYLGIPGRYVDTAAADALRTGARSGADWVVSRRLDKDNKEEALTLLKELSVLAGVWVVQRPDGVLSFRLYDPAAPLTGEISAELATFSPVQLGQADLFTRQHIYYEPRHEDDLESGAARGAWVSGADYSRNDSATVGSVTWYCLQSHKSAAANAPGTGRAYWATDWASGVAYVPGDVRICGGPLYTCTSPHTSGAATQPGDGASWRSKWSSRPIKGGDSASDYHSAYVLVNQQAEVDWGLNKDVAPGDPDYRKNPGYQKQWFEKWNATPAAIASLAARMDSWFATPKMRLKASDLPPVYFDADKYGPGCFVGVTGLQLPVAGAEWGELTDKKPFMILSVTFDTAKCTVSFDLLEV